MQYRRNESEELMLFKAILIVTFVLLNNPKRSASLNTMNDLCASVS